MNLLHGRQTPPEALLSEHRDLDFGHVKPTGMFRRAVPLYLVEQGFCAGFAKRFNQRRFIVRVEVIHHQRQPLGKRISTPQIADEASEIGTFAMPFGMDPPLARLRLEG